jgi:hypothetical protein
MQMRRFVRITPTAELLAGSISAVLADPTPPSRLSEDSVKVLALQWFAQMEAGQIDRSHLTSELS